MSLGIKPFERGLHDLGTGGYAWLQPDGGWGWSNAGLIVSQGEALLVDTLFDVRLTHEMLDVMRAAEPAAAHIDTLVNTHANGDHCNGNELVADAEIISSGATAEELAQESPERLAQMMRLAPGMGEVGEFLQYCFGDFDFENISQTLPTRTFEDTLQIACGDKDIVLKQVGPCHTRGDILVHVPADKLMFTGDILFVEGHPILWAGPVGNWIDACDYILGIDLETVVPGHGPITDHRGVRAVRDYLVYVRDEARQRFGAGLTIYDAAMDISMTDYDAWGDGERIVVNVATLYREFGYATPIVEPAELFALMAKIHKARRR